MKKCATHGQVTRVIKVCAIGLALASALGSHASAVAAQTPDNGPRVKADRGGLGLRCTGQAATPGKLALHIGKSSMLRMPAAVLHRSVGNPNVVQAMLVAPDTMYVLGVDVGATNMMLQDKTGQCSVVDIVVSIDPATLQTTLASVMPDERDIRVTSAADTLVLTGSVSDAAAAARAYELANAFVRRPLRPVTKKSEEAGEGEGESSSKIRVVNMLSVSAPQQVMLEVKIAEVSKSLIERLEAGATFRFSSGSWAGTLLSNFLTGTAGGMLDLRKTNGNQLTLEAQKQDGLVRVLAEPTIMAISGQEGSFLAGGKIFIPVAQDNNKVTLEEKEFGVGLRFTPTVLAGGRINLRVAPEVSEVSRQGIGITASGFGGGAVLPLITTRRASTTVQLYDGQSFAIGGLIKNNFVTNLKGLPLLGEIPILGALFRSTDFQQDRSELVFVVTAHLVKPLPRDYGLPTDNVTAPSRAELFLGGRLEGKAAPGARPAPAAPNAPAQDSARGFELK